MLAPGATHVTAILLFSLTACQYGFTLPSSDPAPASDVKAGDKVPLRMRRGILPGSITGPPPPDSPIGSAQCSTITDGGELMDGCVTGEISCGDVIIGATRGGIKQYDSKFYEHNFCTPRTTNHNSGDERVYKLRITDPNVRALVYLDTPCANLDLAAVKYTSDECPPGDLTTAQQCEENIKPSTTREMVDLWNQELTTWWIIVEGQDDEEGAFALTVQCETINW
jgi:hypothetical protein